MSASNSGPNGHVAVVGGGLAGLSAAVYLARSGKRVTLLEKASALGGRAQTRSEGGFHLNLGPHALYVAGAGSAILRELGISFRGGRPNASGGHAIYGGRKHALPGGFVSLLSTGLLGLGEKLELARVLSAVGNWNAAEWHERSVAEWLAAIARKERVRSLLGALVRLTTYVNDEERLSAGVAISQLQLALAKNVTYIDGGWQTLVDGLAKAAIDAGVVVRTSAKVASVARGDRVTGIDVEGGELLRSEAVVLATAPDVAAALVGAWSPALAAYAVGATPVRAACLDLTLERLPETRSTFALGVDAPLYFSVHSAIGRLAPRGKALIHVAKYLKTTAAGGEGRNEGSSDVRAELEALTDLVQPGWRDAVVEARFLPKMTVAEALPAATGGGAISRPSVRSTDVDGLYFAGDWVGEEGWLADASFATARAAARACLTDLARGGARRAAA
jgi:phytoene dehydrogenase-like protein